MIAGNPIRKKWHSLKRAEYVEEWSDFAVFEKWCEESGYEPGMALLRRNKDLPYGPKNCVWSLSGNATDENSEKAKTIREWNRTVNRLRRAAGLEPFPE